MEISGAGEIILIVSLFVVAILYSSVGHGGASGYLAVMAFLSVSPTRDAPDGFDPESLCRVNRRVSILPARLF